MNTQIAPVIRYQTVKDFVASQPKAQEHYDNSSVLLIDDAKIKYDADFFSRIELPKEYKKIGTNDGVTLSPFIISGLNLVRNPKNPLTKFIKDDLLLSKLVYEFFSLDVQMRKLLNATFPGFQRARSYNCTFRLCPTRSEGLHYDYFLKGAALDPRYRKQTRIKIFLNVDSVSRVWRVGPTLKNYLAGFSDVLPDELPADLNTLNFFLDRIGFVEKCEATTVEIPPGGAIIANGATVAHEVVYGNRMVALEMLGVNPRLSPGFKGEYTEVLNWMQDAGFGVSTDFASFLEQVDGLPSGVERARKKAIQE